MRLSAIGYQLSACCLLIAAPVAAQQQPLQKLPRKHEVELTFAAGYFLPTGAGGQGGGITLNRRGSWVGSVLFGAYAKSGSWGAEVSAALRRSADGTYVPDLGFTADLGGLVGL